MFNLKTRVKQRSGFHSRVLSSLQSCVSFAVKLSELSYMCVIASWSRERS